MNIMKEKDELLELVEHLNKYEHCKKCAHLASCDSWIRHGTRLYDDYDYSVKNCPYFEDLTLNTPERKRGHWEDERNNKIEIQENGVVLKSCWCSECGEWLVGSDELSCIGRYCPNCGAQMN